MAKNRILILVFFFINLVLFSQKKELPEGWDTILLEGKEAYMNLITGDVVTEKPTKAAKKPKKVVEYDPTITHTVSKGETLSIIARKYNLNLAQLYRLNSLEDFDTIEVGQEIVVGYKEEKIQKKSSVKKNDVKEESRSVSVYKIKNGDTLFSIARKHNISVAALKKLNSLNSNMIKVGQKLRIK
ncbi:LysM peptidoglycan-binding domain-containing protein [Tenacibaculum holothuriorum]|uniref:LysM peptidoglycan-binding domain-containing protein n=1 Tax=Tenacibaculum holothuriorum TaxID=1635173 RepID=UPI000A325F7C|nr:LysM peptidoglycan-binding domain-containing protein [Tenacibaculum holothuriorum]